MTQGTNCGLPTSFGTFSPTNFVANGTASSGIIYNAALNSDATPDIVRLELFAANTPFPADITTGTYQLTGAQLNYATCGVCVLIDANFDFNTENSQFVYMATGGSVTINNVTGSISGTLNNVTFQKVTIGSNYVSTPVGDGCVTSITSLPFNAPL